MHTCTKEDLLLCQRVAGPPTRACKWGEGEVQVKNVRLSEFVEDVVNF